jgi:hypothetical protein
MNITKECRKCGLELDSDQFRKHPKTKDGLKYECIKCDDHRQKEYYEKNRAKRIREVSEYRQENPEKVATYNKRYYEKNKAAPEI